MHAKLLDGKKVAETIFQHIKQTVSAFPPQKQPGLAVIVLGNKDASKIYVQRKRDMCREVGFHSLALDFPADFSEIALLEQIERLNHDPNIHGILVQLPLPSHIDSQRILEAIHPNKDVDGFHPYNMGRLVQKRPTLIPCTPAGIIHLLNYYDLPLQGKHAVVLGASNIVGRPMALALLMENSTVTICHSKTQNLSEHIQQADILISAIGRRDIVCTTDIKPGAVVVDVAMNRNENGKLCGDIDFLSASEKASWITPVPGGVGPMTIAMLLQNTLLCYQLQN